MGHLPPSPLPPENRTSSPEHVPGWTFLPESSETEPGHWRGAVRIQADATRIVARMRCDAVRGTRDAAMRDALDFARTARLRVAEQLRRVEAAHREDGSRPPR
ncbi:MAG: hypothetical protein PGN26_11600 [Xylophilus ampelinus]